MLGIVGQSVWVITRGATGHRCAGVFVEDHQLIGVGGGGVHAVKLGYDDDAVHAGQVADGAYHLVGADVDFDKSWIATAPCESINL